MLRTVRCRSVLLWSLLVLCVVQSSFAAESRPQRLVSPELLKHAHLKIVWENELPIRKTERLERLRILGNRLYAISDRNYTTSMNRENGNIIFGRTIAPPGVPIAGLKLYGDLLIYAGGSRLVEIDVASGLEGKTIDVGFGIVCPAARNSSYFYLSGADGRLHVLRAADRVRMFEVAPENNSMITSIVADDAFVIFATDAGNVISFTPDRPKRLWQFDAADAIAAPIVLDQMFLCTAELQFQNTLDSGIITEGLRQKFEESDRLLSQDARVSIEQAGSEWRITDNLKRYSVRKGPGSLYIYDGMSLFLASKDTNVYRIDIAGLPERRRLVWKYQTDGLLEQAPRVTQQVVYQHVPGKGMTAIDKKSGLFLWTVPGGLDLLAEARGRAYVMTKNETLVVMDNVSAKKLYSVNFAGVSQQAANIADSKIYIADNRGRIACLQPVEQSIVVSE